MMISGDVQLAESKRVVAELRNRAKELQPGFDVINDLRYLKISSLSAALQIKNGVKVLAEHGSNRTIRVVGGSKFAIFIFAKYSELTAKGKVFYVPTVEDAEKILRQPRVVKAS